MRGSEFDKRVRECGVLSVTACVVCAAVDAKTGESGSGQASGCGHTCVFMIRHWIILTDRIWTIKKCGGKHLNI